MGLTSIFKRIPQIPSILLACGFTFVIAVIYRKRSQDSTQSEKEKELPTSKYDKWKSSYKQKLNAQFTMLPADRWYQVGHIESIYIYPIMFGKMQKISQCVFSLQSMTVRRENELIRDKMFVVYNKETRHVETKYLSLSTIKVKAKKQFKFKLQATGIEDIIVNTHENWMIGHEKVECKICYGDTLMATVMCIDCGAEAAAWLSKLFFGTESNVRLGYTVDVPHIVEEIWTARENEQPDTITGPFSDQVCYRLMSSRSIDDLNVRTTTYLSNEIFHPHVIIAGVQPFMEDQWDWLRIGSAYFKNVKPAARMYSEKDLTQIPIALRLNLIIINCEIHAQGHAARGDIVYACNIQANN